jgi:tetratricopeptide (TPR) repeat protein
MNRGGTYGDLKQYDQSLRDLDKAIQFDPNLALAYCNRGNPIVVCST